ncbi:MULTISPECIES: hypothetical protein [unclassified Kitasatospora]|uniref:hypothetical protein n=1 Tax=unclassified Kitasatospora TaxID=2633591 RepID=UPI0037F821EC
MANDDGRVWVRGHFRRKPASGGGGTTKASGWVIAGAVAVFWLWGHYVGFTDDAGAPPPTAATPSAVGTP